MLSKRPMTEDEVRAALPGREVVLRESTLKTGTKVTGPRTDNNTTPSFYVRREYTGYGQHGAKEAARRTTRGDTVAVSWSAGLLF